MFRGLSYRRALYRKCNSLIIRSSGLGTSSVAIAMFFFALSRGSSALLSPETCCGKGNPSMSSAPTAALGDVGEELQFRCTEIGAGRRWTRLSITSDAQPSSKRFAGSVALLSSEVAAAFAPAPTAGREKGGSAVPPLSSPSPTPTPLPPSALLAPGRLRWSSFGSPRKSLLECARGVEESLVALPAPVPLAAAVAVEPPTPACARQ
mmetsp:Transcript_1360/g.3126  ORF Transcript_1360/g.3126 Transcript_1360/m.3126 type:complete len:207 (-) Transcript_1360:676-1296(-)